MSEVSDFDKFNFNCTILNALAVKGYVEATPIQSAAIPRLLEGRDLLGIAQTGTGKTAAFALPILEKLSHNRIRSRPSRTRVLVLTPTRELAAQIHESFKTYGRGSGFSSTTVYGGVGMRPQIQAMSRGVDILVATPGRLLDLMSHRQVALDQLEVFVLDEADRMLDMGFIDDIKMIISRLPATRQTMLFSATMSFEISKIANTILKNPVRVEVTPEATMVEKIEQRLHYVERSKKGLLLETILKGNAAKRVLVFTKTKHGADRVVKNLSHVAIRAAAIHGNKTQGAREKALMDFRQGKVRVLIATDIAARGIDVPEITHVINYDLPNDPESYVHRIGRTARAGKDGIAISFCDETEGDLLRAIERVIRGKVPVDADQPYHRELPKPVATTSTRGRMFSARRNVFRSARRPRI